jgi:hypothetical protein
MTENNYEKWVKRFIEKPVDIVTCMSDYRWILDWRMDLLTTYIHDWELQAIVATPLISTIHKITTAPAKPFPGDVSLPAVPWQRLLTVETSVHALRFYLHSLPCSTQLN